MMFHFSSTGRSPFTPQEPQRSNSQRYEPVKGEVIVDAEFEEIKEKKDDNAK